MAEAENKIDENKSRLKNSLTVTFITGFHKFKSECKNKQKQLHEQAIKVTKMHTLKFKYLYQKSKKLKTQNSFTTIFN